jgi:nitrogen fixation/metabolism regulation signal transduction histidine kinase
MTTTVKPADNRPRLLIAWISAGVLLLLVTTSFLTVRSIVVPVRRLLHATARLAKGDVDARVPAGGIKELATLGVAFNRWQSNWLRRRRMHAAISGTSSSKSSSERDSCNFWLSVTR